MADDEVTENDVHIAAQRILAARDHSVAELRKKLKKREFPTDLIEAVLNDFVERRWLDDVRFAELQSDSLVRQLWGPQKIVQKLVKHGVAHSLARETVDALEVDWTERATARLEKKFPNRTDDDKRAIYRHLESRGFYGETIRAILFD